MDASYVREARLEWNFYGIVLGQHRCAAYDSSSADRILNDACCASDTELKWSTLPQSVSNDPYLLRAAGATVGRTEFINVRVIAVRSVEQSPSMAILRIRWQVPQLDIIVQYGATPHAAAIVASSDITSTPYKGDSTLVMGRCRCATPPASGEHPLWSTIRFGSSTIKFILGFAQIYRDASTRSRLSVGRRGIAVIVHCLDQPVSYPSHKRERSSRAVRASPHRGGPPIIAADLLCRAWVRLSTGRRSACGRSVKSKSRRIKKLGLVETAYRLPLIS
ncbi:hypothetical protein C8Q73DRAFT_493568 [Cubamyces lactineus]|nr:hypothetical protein C8Q73DRAFT_493568 [Cubamyces lactineus]